MRSRDQPKPYLVIHLLVTAEERKISWLMHSLHHVCTSPAAIAPKLNPGADCGVTIFVKITFIYRQMIAHHLHRHQTLGAQIMTVLGHILPTRVRWRKNGEGKGENEKYAKRGRRNWKLSRAQQIICTLLRRVKCTGNTSIFATKLTRSSHIGRVYVFKSLSTNTKKVLHDCKDKFQEITRDMTRHIDNLTTLSTK